MKEFPASAIKKQNKKTFLLLLVPEKTRLSPICQWKHIFLRMTHLNKNWARGRYNVLPILRGHNDKVTCMDCQGNAWKKKKKKKQASETRELIWFTKSSNCRLISLDLRFHSQGLRYAITVAKVFKWFVCVWFTVHTEQIKHSFLTLLITNLPNCMQA